jgi:hypothetical protein
MKRADLVAGERYRYASVSDPLASYGENGIVTLVDNRPRLREMSTYEIAQKLGIKQRSYAYTAEQLSAIREARHAMTLDELFPATDKGAEVLVRREDGNHGRYELMLTRHLRMTEAEYKVALKARQKSNEEARARSEAAQQEHEEIVRQLRERLDSLGVAYAVDYSERRGGTLLGEIHLRTRGRNDVEINAATLVKLIDRAVESVRGLDL